MERKGLQTSTEIRKAIIELHGRGLRNAEVSRQLGVSKRTVGFWVRRFSSTASLSDNPRIGRPRKTTPQEDRVIAEAVKADPFSTAVDIKQLHNLSCSVQTIRNRMHTLKRISHSSAKPPLTKFKSGVVVETSPCTSPVPPFSVLPSSPLALPASATLPQSPTNPVKREISSDEMSGVPSASYIKPSSAGFPAQDTGKRDAQSCRKGGERPCAQAEPAWEGKVWPTVWIKREDESDFKVEVQDELMEAEDTDTAASGATSRSRCVDSRKHRCSPSTERQKAENTGKDRVAALLHPDLEGDTLQVIPHCPEDEHPAPGSPASSVAFSDSEERNSIILEAEYEPFQVCDSEIDEGADGDETFPFRDIFFDSDSSSIDSEEEPIEVNAGPSAEKVASVPWEWVKGDFVPQMFLFDSSNSGVSSKVRLTEDSSELDCFLYFFDTTLMTLIKRETNLQYHTKKKRNLWYTNINHWEDVTVNELYLFFGLCLFMPHISNLDKSDIWSSILGIQAPFIFKAMSEERYRMIAKMLYFSSAYSRTKDPLGKIRPVYNHLRKRFREVINPYRNIVIDESQLLFKSRLAFRHSIPSKEHEYEAKTYVLCDSKTGFIIDFLIYSSRVREGASQDPHGTSGAIVKRLLEPLYGQGHTVFLGSWCTSPQLFHYLLTKKVGACGMVKPDCRNCPEFEYVSRGTSTHYHANNVLAVKWHYRTSKEHLLTTVHGWDPAKHNRPQPFADFRSNTKRLAISDTQVFFTDVKAIKWYKKLFYHLLDLTILNAYMLFVAKTGSRPHYNAFHRQLIKQIFERFAGEVMRLKLKTPSTESLPLRFALSKGHFARLLVEKEGEKEVQKSCYVCANTIRRPQKQKTTCYYCSVCGISLCIVPCFEHYHTLKDF